MTNFHAILKQYWNYEDFRSVQLEVIRSVDAGCDTMVLMPTGGGKSVTYQVLALSRDGVCVVITPLIALMKDQVDGLRRRGIKALAIYSGMTPRQIDIALDNCVYGDVKFLYISPERIDSEIFWARFSRMNVSLIAVDEAHCISQWGYDFRPVYLRIARLREISPHTPVLALTASATPAVVRDIVEKLEFREPRLFQAGFARGNLSYVVRQTANKLEQLLRVIHNVGGSGIVYTRTREGAEKIAAFLRENGITADHYHGGLANLMRSIRQDRWLRGELQVMVATNAFGMGIDKADVRYVVHMDLCDSLEAYYQEAGRAGRDGRPAYAAIFLTEQDKLTARKRVDLEFPPVDKIREIYQAICTWFQIPLGGGREAAREFNIFEFCSQQKYFPATVVNALKILQLNGYMLLTDESDHPVRVVFTVQRDDLYRIQVGHPDLDFFIKVLLRTYTGIFTDFVAVNEQEIAHLSGYTVERVQELFKRLWQMRIIKYIPGSRSSMIVLLDERLDNENLRISPESYRIRKEVAQNRLKASIAYAENSTECRSLLLQRYFGERAEEPCGQCDICRESRKKMPGNRSETQLRIRILEELEAGEKTLHQLVSALQGELAVVLEEIRMLTAQGSILQRPDGRIQKK
ncbi:MAG: RecQ family ATP-dependent DNA helicase [Rikenellaceae bacterium]|nr:RecQ family ATP-dependent DNA helicase [Rikenellaceae bacterium]